MPKGLLVTANPGKTAPIELAPGVVIGAGSPLVMAGPCSVESREQIEGAALAVRAAGAHVLRAGAFKPRTSPYSFQGLAEEGLKLLAQARALTGMPVVTEVLDTADVELVAGYTDIVQVGARNMQNYRLLQALGRQRKPVLLKRGPAATIDEWLHAAEYVLSEGNDRVILCERGIRTFEPHTRYTLDLASAVAAKGLTHLPVIADPSHGTGRRELVAPMVRAALAAGLDGVMVEVHPEPEGALSDGAQMLSTAEFHSLMSLLGLCKA